MRTYKNVFAAIRANDIEAVKTFLPDRLNARDIEGKTLLHCACQYGHTEIARLLLDRGADINARDKDGNTPLHEVCVWGSETILCLMLDRGADVEARNKYGCTPLHLASDNDEQKVSEIMVSRGADPFALDNHGCAALDRDTTTAKDKDGNYIPHSQILVQLRAEYLNKHAVKASERTAALSSGWEMEM